MDTTCVCYFSCNNLYLQPEAEEEEEELVVSTQKLRIWIYFLSTSGITFANYDILFYKNFLALIVLLQCTQEKIPLDDMCTAFVTI